MCSVEMTVRPCFWATESCTWRMTSNAVVLSRPVVGSSNRTTRGCAMSPRATATRFFSPPEMPRTVSEPMRTCAHLVRPSRSMISSAICSWPSAWRSRADVATISRTVSVEMQLNWFSRETSVMRWRHLGDARLPS
mmetsp:Transcript_818/g.2744  ORF Transcript_818/g.2744 Transcript_818/m.2744 type:complete len:136 (+) Transcript_818:1129-1536(+)